MSKHLYAIHDWSDTWGAIVRSAGVSAWAVISEGIGDNPDDRNGGNYESLAGFDVTPIVRLNYSHHGAGTIPLHARYNAFSQRCANYVQASSGAVRWIIGNEPNLKDERPDGVVITPGQYANCFAKCRTAIKARDTQHQVIVAAVAPYNVDTGPWLEYWRQMLLDIERLGGADGLALHTYARGPFPNHIFSNDKMDAPYGHLYNGFRAYRDFLAMVPDSLRDLPVYITETDQIGMWRNETTGWVQAAYEEINNWNHGVGNQKIYCLALYRLENYDQWGFRDKPGVIEDFRAALAHRYKSPPQPDNQIPVGSIKPIEPMKPIEPTMPTQITEDFKRRVPHFTAAQPEPGQRYYKLIKAEYIPNGAQRFGPDHHILVDVLDAQGKRAMGVPVNVFWDGNEKIIPISKINEPYGMDFAMYAHGNSYGVWIGDSHERSDWVNGMGLGTIEQPDWNHHVTYYLVFQETVAPAKSTVYIPQASKGKVPMLVHPVENPAYRGITQRFGGRPEVYSQYKIDNVPLKGHEGLDIAAPFGAWIVAVDDGMAVEVADQGGKGYGKYIKLQHEWGESVYAHLSTQTISHGARVKAGDRIGQAGYTGNVEPKGPRGAHLHFGMRVNPYIRSDGWGGYVDPSIYLQNAQSVAPKPVAPSDLNIVDVLRRAAQEFEVEPELLLSQAWAESSFNPKAVSSAGAQGLLQIMPDTWREWSSNVKGGNDPFDAQQNARVGAAYLRWLMRQAGNEYGALVAYGWGIGNLLSGDPIPPGWHHYATKILHGRDLLKAVTR